MALLELEELAHHVAHPAQSPQAQPFHNVYLRKTIIITEKGEFMKILSEFDSYQMFFSYL
jgi:hypothetical protein